MFNICGQSDREKWLNRKEKKKKVLIFLAQAVYVLFWSDVMWHIVNNIRGCHPKARGTLYFLVLREHSFVAMSFP